jgi:hypothetical protein
MQCAHAILSPGCLPRCTIFFTLSHKRHDFREEMSNIKFVLNFYSSFISNIYQSNKNSARYRKCRYVFIHSTCYSCQILIKPEFSRQVFAKSSNIQFHENPSSGSRVVACGQTDRRTNGYADRRTDMTKVTVAFRYFANVLKNNRYSYV